MFLLRLIMSKFNKNRKPTDYIFTDVVYELGVIKHFVLRWNRWNLHAAQCILMLKIHQKHVIYKNYVIT